MNSFIHGMIPPFHVKLMTAISATNSVTRRKTPFLSVHQVAIQNLLPQSEFKDDSFTYKCFWKGIVGGILTFDMLHYILRFLVDKGVTGILLWYFPLFFSLQLISARHLYGSNKTTSINKKREPHPHPAEETEGTNNFGRSWV